MVSGITDHVWSLEGIVGLLACFSGGCGSAFHVRPMKITLRHFVAIGLTTALAFGLFQSWFEGHIFQPGHPTPFDMIWFILTTFFGSLGAICLLIFPIITTVESLIGKQRVVHAVCILALPVLIPPILLLLATLFDGNNQLTGGFKFPFLISVLSWMLAGSILFCALFYFYCGIVCFERLIAFLSRKFKHRPNPTP